MLSDYSACHCPPSAVIHIQSITKTGIGWDETAFAKRNESCRHQPSGGARVVDDGQQRQLSNCIKTTYSPVKEHMLKPVWP